jgi:integrase
MDRKYLVRQYNTWSVVVEVPKHLRSKAGRVRFKRSLGTDSLIEANRLKHAHVADFQRQISALEGGSEHGLAVLYRDAAEWKPALAAAGTATQADDQGRVEFEERDFLISEVKRLASVVAEQHGDEVGKRYLATALGQGTSIKDQIEGADPKQDGPWIAESPDSGQTKSQHKSAVRRYLAWAGQFTTVEETDRIKAGEYVSHLLTSSGLARRTIKRHLSSLSNLWLWLESKGIKRENVWLGHRLGKKKGKVRKGLSDELVLKVLNGSYSTRKFAQPLKDLTRLALLHGARLDELCAARTADVTKREDGYWIKIGDGKTESAIREIPVHSKAVPIVERLLEDEDEFLFKGLAPGGPDEKRSWYVSKAYGRYRRQVEVDGPYQDFHALRNTFLELMEGVEVAESTAKLLVGHKRESMTYGHYSKGQRVNLRSAIEKVDYGPEVMKAIASA